MTCDINGSCALEVVTAVIRPVPQSCVLLLKEKQALTFKNENMLLTVIPELRLKDACFD